MSDPDAYPDEMGSLRPRDIDEPEFSTLVDELRSAYVREPDPEVGSRHLAAMLEQAKSVPVAPASPPSLERRRRFGLIARLGIAAAGFALLSGGLALAGVDLPVLPEGAREPARETVKSGETEETSDDVIVPSVDVLPDDVSDTAVSVLETIEATLPLLQDGDISGCEFGAMVSAAAREVEPDTSHCKDGASASEGAGGSKGAEASAEGRARADAAKAAGQAKGEAASGGKANAGGRSDSGSGPSGGGKANADQAKAAGQAKGEEASGGKANAGGNNPND